MKPFTDTLREINGGKFSEELTEAFAALILDVASTQKQGSITLNIKLKPGKGSGKVMTVEHDFDVKSPQFDRPSDYMFVAGNALVLDNPDQRKLDLREVTASAPTEFREVKVDKETGEILDPAAASAAA